MADRDFIQIYASNVVRGTDPLTGRDARYVLAEKLQPRKKDMACVWFKGRNTPIVVIIEDVIEAVEGETYTLRPLDTVYGGSRTAHTSEIFALFVVIGTLLDRGRDFGVFTPWDRLYAPPLAKVFAESCPEQDRRHDTTDETGRIASALDQLGDEAFLRAPRTEDGTTMWLSAEAQTSELLYDLADRLRGLLDDPAGRIDPSLGWDEEEAA